MFFLFFVAVFSIRPDNHGRWNVIRMEFCNFAIMAEKLLWLKQLK